MDVSANAYGWVSFSGRTAQTRVQYDYTNVDFMHLWLTLGATAGGLSKPETTKEWPVVDSTRPGAGTLVTGSGIVEPDQAPSLAVDEDCGWTAHFDTHVRARGLYGPTGLAGSVDRNDPQSSPQPVCQKPPQNPCDNPLTDEVEVCDGSDGGSGVADPTEGWSEGGFEEKQTDGFILVRCWWIDHYSRYGYFLYREWLYCEPL
jgi:hypothetical protein